MNTPLSDLPVPKIKEYVEISNKSIKEKQLKPKDYLDQILSKDFLKEYFVFSKHLNILPKTKK